MGFDSRHRNSAQERHFYQERRVPVGAENVDVCITSEYLSGLLRLGFHEDKV
jgi:hypothetical protein